MIVLVPSDPLGFSSDRFVLENSALGMTNANRWTRTAHDGIQDFEAQIAFILRQAEEGTPVGQVCRKAGIRYDAFINRIRLRKRTASADVLECWRESGERWGSRRSFGWTKALSLCHAI